MSIIQQLLKEAKAAELDRFNSQFAYRDLPEGRLSVTITHYDGGDGQVKDISTRTNWVYCGKDIGREELETRLLG